MTKIRHRLFFSIIVCLLTFNQQHKVYAQQERMHSIESKMTVLSTEIQGLESRIDISVSDVPIQDFVRAIARNSNLNIHIDPNIDLRITANYSQVRVLDIILFLCKEYNLDFSSTGNIISLFQYQEPVLEKPKPVKKELEIEYNTRDNLLSVNLSKDSLENVAKKITDLTKRNIIITPDLSNVLISGYIQNGNFDTSLEKLMLANQLSISRTDDNFYIIEKADPKTASSSSRLQKGNLASETREGLANSEITFHSKTNFSIRTKPIPLETLVRMVSDTLGVNYVLLDKLEGEAQLNLVNVTYDNMLSSLFQGKDYCFKLKEGTYLIGKSDHSLLTESKLIKLQHRTISSVTEMIPDYITKNLIAKEFVEQNAFFVTGSQQKIEKFELFIREIDRLVPLILIEILIVEVSKSKAVSVGINAGLTSNNEDNQKSISPNFNYDVSPQTINNVLGKINSLGWINLGKVGNNFYLNLQALEDNNKLVIRSTPKLATLNGHEAVMSSGEKKYYKEERSNFIGSQNPALSNYYEWKPVEANLVVKIMPIVSGDDQITLSISVEQTQFTKQGTEGSPPESVMRKFESLIRMKDQEMVLLGGLDKVSSTDASSGFPILSRIPVIKWFFGSTNKSKSDSKLSLFIQPTIIY